MENVIIELAGTTLDEMDEFCAETLFEHLSGECFDKSYDADWIKPGDTYVKYLNEMADKYGREMKGSLRLISSGSVIREATIPGNPDEK